MKIQRKISEEEGIDGQEEDPRKSLPKRVNSEVTADAAETSVKSWPFGQIMKQGDE